MMKSLPVLIRSYVASDWPQLCRVHDKARMVELDGSVDLSAFKHLNTAIAEEDDLFAGEVLVAIHDGLLVGFIAFTPDEVTWLYVDPAHFQKGVASQLLHKALQSCERCVRAVVLHNNRQALSFYKKHGFEILGRTDGHLSGDKTVNASGYTLQMCQPL